MEYFKREVEQSVSVMDSLYQIYLTTNNIENNDNGNNNNNNNNNKKKLTILIHDVIHLSMLTERKRICLFLFLTV
uniref:Uncharacterized protein n=1 Tax=Octopus bimaculoides TaxID=37653 RepID=A0A0L8HQI7_OCTBM